MNTFFKSIFLSLSLFISLAASAQDSVSKKKKKEFANSFTILPWTYTDYPKVEPAFTYLKVNANAPTQYGLAYERKIYKNFKLILGYALWNNAPWLFRSIPDGYYINGPDPVYKKGGIEYRKKYKMADLLFMYRYNKFERHKVDIGVGPSYHWGVNTIIDSIDYNVFESFMLTSDHKAAYFGAVYAFNYNYLMFNNRISIGVDARYRRYIGYRITQVDYGLHAGFNF